MVLSSNTNLITLNLNCVYVKGEASRWRLSWISTILQTVKSRKLRRITVALQHETEYVESNLDALDWKVIDQALVPVVRSQNNFDAIIFRVRAPQAEDEWAEQSSEAILSRLPKSRLAQVPIRILCQSIKPDMPKQLFPVIEC